MHVPLNHFFISYNIHLFNWHALFNMQWTYVMKQIEYNLHLKEALHCLRQATLTREFQKHIYTNWEFFKGCHFYGALFFDHLKSIFQQQIKITIV